MPMQHREADRRQLWDIESKVFQTGFSHSRKDWLKESLGHPTVLVTRFSEHVLPLLQRDPRTNLEGNTIYSLICRRTPGCDFCKRTETMRATSSRNQERREGRTPRATTFWVVVAEDHKVPNEEKESPLHYRYAAVIQGIATQWIQTIRAKNKTPQNTMRSLQRFLLPQSKPGVIYLQ